MLPVIDPTGRRAGRQAVGYAAALLVASLMPALLGLSGFVYAGVAVILGLALLMLAGSVVYPILWALNLSAHTFDAVNPGKSDEFVGLANYATLVSDPSFWDSVLNTFYFALLTVIPLTALGQAKRIILMPSRWASSVSAFLTAANFGPYSGGAPLASSGRSMMKAARGER